MEHPEITFQLLKQITDGFSEERKIGQGAFGTVYRAVHENGKEIAVKMLKDKDPGLDDKRFEDEFHKLRVLSHPNIVKLIGYCYDPQHEYILLEGAPMYALKIYRALCFEYLHKGSLQKHLSDECNGLDWHTRYNIIKGTCEGLKYLHTGLENPIYHFDLKPDNILLDNNMMPKLADFGLSNILERTRSSEGVQGTLGYMPPEYVGNKSVRSTKFDVFSLGIVILEIVAGPTARSRITDMSYEEFSGLVQANWRMRLQKAWSGCSLEAYCQQVNTCIDVALKCIDFDRNKRPHIANVVEQLAEIELEISKAVLLGVQSVELQFHSDPNDQTTSSMLHLTNNTVSPVAFRLLTLDSEYLLRPLGGMVPPLSGCAVAVTMNMSEQKQMENRNVCFILESTIAVNQGVTFDAADNYKSFFREARKDGRMVQQVKLSAFYNENPVSGKGNPTIDMVQQSKNNIYQQQNLTLTAEISYNEPDYDSRETYSDVTEELIVGRTEEKEKIIASLLQSDIMAQNITILPIYGIGGIGKTTLAKMIYNDTKFKYYSQVWVYVSPRFNPNKIGNSIISQLSEKESQLKEKQMIRRCLKTLLAGKKILIVLDDLWEYNRDILFDLKTMLMLGEKGNTVVIATTRDERIAKEIGTVEPHKIELLTKELCWDIIKHKSGFEARDDKEQLKDIGMDIALKCGGVPLAAQSLGYTLRFKDLHGWKKVNESDVWSDPNLTEGSFQNEVLAALRLSYSSMDRPLRLCFRYCAIFPKGHNIAKDGLTYQWISLGFIGPALKPPYKKCQLSEMYIVHLVGMSFFQPLSPQVSYFMPTQPVNSLFSKSNCKRIYIYNCDKKVTKSYRIVNKTKLSRKSH